MANAYWNIEERRARLIQDMQEVAAMFGLGVLYVEESPPTRWQRIKGFFGKR